MYDTVTSGTPMDWQATMLWHELQQRKSPHFPEAEAVRTTLKQCMPDIQRILLLGNTSPSDFTLHDSNHSYRVAQWMTQVIPMTVLSKLTTYELALLLLSAYLHDIGMTPERRKVKLHYQYLMSGEKGEMLEEEIESFQAWLDEQRAGLVPPLVRSAPSPAELSLAEEIITYYCRDKHVDWSEEWIQENLSHMGLGTYSGWVNDLTILCRSHRQNYHELSRPDLNPRMVGTPPQVLNLRYLALVLRIADTLDIDPERTPDVILRHRDIAAKSLLYWYKDEEISLALDGDRKIIVTARPSSARIHRAIELTVNQLDDELRLCKRIADETHLEKMPNSAQVLPHAWDLPFSVHTDVRPKEGTYEYIIGAFRPDTTKLLELLSGTELYGNPLVAIRELLQNAFDAVREQMAYSRLVQATDPLDPLLVQSLETLNRVRLSLEKDDSGIWLSCLDSGVGMSKSIIEKYLLVSGKGTRREILDLDRRCRQAGFNLGRTGQFGIGVLSYFMIADHVIITTRRSHFAGDSESNGWTFETGGIGSFGELRRNMSLSQGTHIRLHIRRDVLGDSPNDWFQQVTEYLKSILLRLPCNLDVENTLTNTKLNFPPGWGQNYAAFSERVIEDLKPSRYALNDKDKVEIKSVALSQKLESIERSWHNLRQKATQLLRWESEVGELPDQQGIYRIHVPYFELPGGPSLCFLNTETIDNNTILHHIGSGYFYLPEGVLRMGWKGFRISPARKSARDSLLAAFFRNSQRSPEIIEIDWHSIGAGKIAVDRHTFDFSEDASAALQWVNQRANDKLVEFLHAHHRSIFATLNESAINRILNLNPTPWWAALEGDALNWKPIVFRVTDSHPFTYNKIPKNVNLNGEPVTVLRSLGDLTEGGHHEGVNWLIECFLNHFVASLSMRRMLARYVMASLTATVCS